MFSHHHRVSEFSTLISEIDRNKYFCFNVLVHELGMIVSLILLKQDKVVCALYKKILNKDAYL